MMRLSCLLPLAFFAVAQEQIPLNAAPQPLLLDAIPLLGFGTWNLKEPNTSQAVSWAIQMGYRHIDCAAVYGNEEVVGQGIADGLGKTGLSREDLWITSKLWNDHHAPEQVENAVDISLSKLGLDYLDLYHMHWPVADIPGSSSKEISYLDTWRAMTKLVKKGKTRHIGVSNFSPKQLEILLANTDLPPVVHQMEMHPYLQQQEFLDFHKNHSIHVTAYSPLAGTNPTYAKGDPTPLLKNDVMKKIAEKRNCTTAQVALQFGMSRGTSVIPKSIHKDYIEQNFRAPECILQGKDLKELHALGESHHRYNNPSENWGVSLYEGLEDDDGKHGRAHYWDGE